MDPMLWPLFVVIAIVGLLFLLVPGRTRPDLYFAVTVEPSFRASADGRRAALVYRILSLASTLLALAVLAFAAPGGARRPWMLSALLVQLAGTTAGFLLARRLVRPHAAAPATTREAALAPARSALPGGRVLQAIPFAVLAAAAGVLAWRWADVPARIPVHWTLTGQADRFVDKTPAAAAAQLVVAALVCGLMAATASLVMRSRRIQPSGESASGESSFRLIAAIALLAAELLIAVLVSQPAVQLLFPWVARRQVVLTTTAGTALVAVLVAVLFRLGQGGSRRARVPESGAPVGDRTPDSAWVLGLFYFNPDDPALMVEKRFGIGYTLNFAHPVAWAFIALLAVVIAVAVLARR